MSEEITPFAPCYPDIEKGAQQFLDKNKKVKIENDGITYPSSANNEMTSIQTTVPYPTKIDVTGNADSITVVYQNKAGRRQEYKLTQEAVTEGDKVVYYVSLKREGQA